MIFVSKDLQYWTDFDRPEIYADGVTIWGTTYRKLTPLMFFKLYEKMRIFAKSEKITKTQIKRFTLIQEIIFQNGLETEFYQGIF